MFYVFFQKWVLVPGLSFPVGSSVSVIAIQLNYLNPAQQQQQQQHQQPIGGGPGPAPPGQPLNGAMQAPGPRVLPQQPQPTVQAPPVQQPQPAVQAAQVQQPPPPPILPQQPVQPAPGVVQGASGQGAVQALPLMPANDHSDDDSGPDDDHDHGADVDDDHDDGADDSMTRNRRRHSTELDRLALWSPIPANLPRSGRTRQTPPRLSYSHEETTPRRRNRRRCTDCDSRVANIMRNLNL